MVINIQKQLDKAKISRYELAKQMGVTYPTIDKIYKGTSTSIKLDTLEGICNVLKCTPNDILVPNDFKASGLVKTPDVATVQLSPVATGKIQTVTKNKKYGLKTDITNHYN